MFSHICLFALLVPCSLQYSMKDKIIPKHLQVAPIIGVDCNIQNYPYMLLNLIDVGLGRVICSGAIISSSWGLIAAHCTADTTNTGIESTAGYGNNKTEQTRTSITVVMHGSYNPNTMENDIAVFQVSPKWIMTTAVGTICVPPAGWQATGQATLIGWGTGCLVVATVDIITDTECSNVYGASSIHDSSICVSAPSDDLCSVASSGLLVKSGRVAGVISWSISCARPNFPVVLTETSAYTQWIAAQTGVEYC